MTIPTTSTARTMPPSKHPATSDGYDTIVASLDYTLRGGSGIEVLKALEGEDPIDLTGSDEENDTLIGNKGSNTLDGKDGNDTLDGGDGNDVLIGGTGTDELTGGDGNDTYYVDANDTVEEDTGGEDLLIAVAAGKYTLAKGIDNGEADTGAGKVYLIGNESEQ